MHTGAARKKEEEKIEKLKPHRVKSSEGCLEQRSSGRGTLATKAQVWLALCNAERFMFSLAQPPYSLHVAFLLLLLLIFPVECVFICRQVHALGRKVCCVLARHTKYVSWRDIEAISYS